MICHLYVVFSNSLNNTMTCHLYVALPSRDLQHGELRSLRARLVSHARHVCYSQAYNMRTLVYIGKILRNSSGWLQVVYHAHPDFAFVGEAASAASSAAEPYCPSSVMCTSTEFFPLSLYTHVILIIQTWYTLTFSDDDVLLDTSTCVKYSLLYCCPPQSCPSF